VALNLPFALVAGATAVLQRPGLGGPLPISGQRRWLETMARVLPGVPGTSVTPVELAGRPALRITSEGAASEVAVMHIHGGGYTVGSPRTHRSLGSFLARAAGATVYLPSYRLAPEHPYPAALEDCLAAWRELAETHHRLALSGDSAGGALAAVATRRLIDAGDVVPSALGLISPAVNPLKLGSRSRDLVIRTKWGMASSRMYLGDADPSDPNFAPLFGSVAGFPPTLVQVGRKEVLYEQDVEFAEKLRAAGIESRLTVFPRLWHVGHTQAGLLREAREAVDELGAWLRPS